MERRGLGLAAVSGIVRSHHGGLRLETSSGGTCFELAFPVTAATEAPTAASTRSDAETATAAPGERHHVLLIDDDEHVTRLVTRVLGREGIEVHSASDGEAGVALFREATVEIPVVVLDLSMPGLSAEETLARLREVAPGVRVLLSSGLPPQEVHEHFDPLGVNGDLAKPYTARRLVEVVRTLLGG